MNRPYYEFYILMGRTSPTVLTHSRFFASFVVMVFITILGSLFSFLCSPNPDSFCQ